MEGVCCHSLTHVSTVNPEILAQICALFIHMMQTRIEILKEINREIKRTFNVDVFFFYFLFHSPYLLNIR